MSKRKQTEVELEEVQAVPAEAAVTDFFQNHKLILYILGGLALAVAAWFAYKSFVVAPQQKEAEANIWKAQQYFDRDSFQLALESPIGDYEGFLSIIDKYGSSKAGNAAKYYAGVSYMNLGDYDKAIQYLDDFSPSDELLPITKYGALGDCYSEKGDMDKGLSFYDKAISAGKNELLTSYYMKKAGMLCEYQNRPSDALKYYKELKEKYPMSPAGTDIDKYIARVGGVN